MFVALSHTMVIGVLNKFLAPFQELFGLTNAEAHLAQALCTDMTTTAYAAERHISVNTVYSHLKRIREKTGCKSLPELIRKFGELSVPMRPD
ncbi:MAG TPA: helix-turn-helix transcriptional regulator [Pseudolabrys sp.]|nr:helix-turn-helix transcriptional regulator [Pseudolabrys sp.]